MSVLPPRLVQKILQKKERLGLCCIGLWAPQHDAPQLLWGAGGAIGRPAAEGRPRDRAQKQTVLKSPVGTGLNEAYGSR
jgi:hypothetical protein